MRNQIKSYTVKSIKDSQCMHERSGLLCPLSFGSECMTRLRRTIFIVGTKSEVNRDKN